MCRQNKTWSRFDTRPQAAARAHLIASTHTCREREALAFVLQLLRWRASRYYIWRSWGLINSAGANQKVTIIHWLAVPQAQFGPNSKHITARGSRTRLARMGGFLPHPHPSSSLQRAPHQQDLVLRGRGSPLQRHARRLREALRHRRARGHRTGHWRVGAQDGRGGGHVPDSGPIYQCYRTEVWAHLK